ncbi:MAG: aminotransferase class V-fold PLP-dependent enzyme [Verrucomicrobia bacterium]|nr:aminotransferase class V-fold PLP-dependent enzyme [Verrucomicrobiota bacterium]
MTLSEILSSEELRREEFPVARTKIFLGHAGVCPLPRRVADAMAHYAFNASEDDQETILPELLRQSRDIAARLVGAQPDEISFVGPTSLALSFVAASLPFRKGDNVLIYHDDYPTNVYPWMALADRGVQVRLLNARELGRIRPLDVAGQVDEQTRLVALASCHFVAGWRLDLDAIGRSLRERNILFCVDGIQTLGAFPTPVKHVDFLAADAHKWLLGPCAAGILYVKKDLQERLRPPVLGWNNVRCPNYVAQEAIMFRSGPARFEAGSHNVAGLVGLKACMELLLELGVENIAAELLRKRQWLVPALEANGWSVLHAKAPRENAGAILSLHRKDADVAAVHKQLAAANIVTSLRADRTGRQYLRLSPHCYNTDDELRRVLEML